MTLSQDYAAATRRYESVITEALDTWKNGLNAMTAPLQAFPTTGHFPAFDAAEAVERQIQLFQKVVDVNSGYARQLAEATNTVAGAVREHIEGLNSVFREQVQSVAEATQVRVGELEDTVRGTADEAVRLQREVQERTEQVQRAERKQTEEAEREERRQARKAARDHYRSLNKNELSDEAAKRNLRKTGTLDELVERLVEDDTKN